MHITSHQGNSNGRLHAKCVLTGTKDERKTMKKKKKNI